jgi:HPt (histidine-containing phosphotransfer) domain-containing protein
VKGSGAQVGARELVRLCAELEALVRSGRLGGAAGSVERLEAEYARVRAALVAELRPG